MDSVTILSIEQADVQVSVSAARSYLRSFVHTDEFDAVVFDIDETALSNMPYYREHRYGYVRFTAKAMCPSPPAFALYSYLRG